MAAGEEHAVKTNKLRLALAAVGKRPHVLTFGRDQGSFRAEAAKRCCFRAKSAQNVVLVRERSTRRGQNSSTAAKIKNYIVTVGTDYGIRHRTNKTIFKTGFYIPLP